MPRLHPLFAVLPPLAAAAYIIFAYGVNAPFWDQWELVPLLAKQQAGALTLHDLLEQHNEHRMLFPQLIMVGLASLTGWDIRAELAVNLGLATAAVAALVYATRSSLAAASNLARGMVYLTFSATVMTVAQWENWLWGWQIQWFLALVTVIATAFLLNAALNARQNQRLPVYAALLLAAGGAAAITQFSLASGVMLWAIGALAIILHPAPGAKFSFAAWAVMGGASTAAFFHGWRSVPIPGMPSPLEALSDPLPLVKYVLSYLSGPLRRIDFFDVVAALNLPAWTVGAAVLALVALLGLYLLASDWSRRAETLPWLALAAFACGGGAITGLGRVGFGVEHAATSRYVTLSLLLTVAAIGLYVVLLGRHPGRSWLGWLGGALAAAALTCVAATDYANLDGVKARSNQLAAGRVCLLDLAAASDDCVKANLYPDAGVVRAREPILRAYGWSGFANR